MSIDLLFVTERLGRYTAEFDLSCRELWLSRPGESISFTLEEAQALEGFLHNVLPGRKLVVEDPVPMRKETKHTTWGKYTAIVVFEVRRWYAHVFYEESGQVHSSLFSGTGWPELNHKLSEFCSNPGQLAWVEGEPK